MKQIFAGLAALCAAGMPLVAQAADVRIGTKGFTENILAGEITKQYLESKGIGTKLTSGLGSNVVRQARVSGQIDLYWEYTGPALVNYHNTPGIPRTRMVDKLNELDGPNGLEWLDSSKVNDTYALAVRRETAQSKGLRTTSDLAAAVNAGKKITFGCNAEFYARPDGLKPLESTYGFSFGRDAVVRMDTGLVYQALRDGQVSVGLVFATDGRIPAFDFVVLKDDKGYFPTYAMTPVVRKEVLDANPTLAGILNGLSAKLDDAVMAKLNASVDVDKKTVEEVSAGFLKAQGLI
jgi:osmoprotectant transport system substrate-binding protein